MHHFQDQREEMWSTQVNLTLNYFTGLVHVISADFIVLVYIISQNNLGYSVVQSHMQVHKQLFLTLLFSTIYNIIPLN